LSSEWKSPDVGTDHRSASTHQTITGTQIQCTRLLTGFRWLSPYSSNHRSMLRIGSGTLHHRSGISIVPPQARGSCMIVDIAGIGGAECGANRHAGDRLLALLLLIDRSDRRRPRRMREASHSRSTTVPTYVGSVGMTGAERNAAILAALSAATIKSILFVTRTDG
jgi:hypothetical protein